MPKCSADHGSVIDDVDETDLMAARGTIEVERKPPTPTAKGMSCCSGGWGGSLREP